jgi:lycopene beta-cyclase
MEPYAYKIIKGDRFYAFVKGCLAQNPNITIVQTEVLSKVDGQDNALVNTTSGEFKGQFVFNSIPEKVEKKPNHNYLLQHFKGWWVKTKTPFFNPQEPTLMDFRIFQDGQCRFMYVLPVSEFEALVEFTIFSESHLEPEQYNIELEKYFLEYLNLEDFEIVHQEFGSIPMFSEAFPKKQGKRIFNIGTAGGQTKASTGYTFTRIQRHSRQLVQNLSQTGSPMVETGLFQSRFEWYDNVLLHVLARNVVGGAKVFQNLFKYNKPASIFRFLDEDSHFLNEYRIMNTVPILKFIGPGWKELMNLGK